MPFTFKRLQMPDVILIEPKLFSDSRGFFFEFFKESEFSANGIPDKFIQDNFSHSVKNVIRGLHYQKPPNAQSKLVTVINGKILDVVVDIRKNSPTFGKWLSVLLSSDDHAILYVPQGFAHGFCVLSDEADVLYKVNNEYSPNDERGIIWNDPDINIKWPVDKPILTKKDLESPTLKNADNNFT